MNSHNIARSVGIINSSEIRNCKELDNCLFCAESERLKNCLFCFGIENANYCVFNTPIDPKRFEFYIKQYKKIKSFYPLDFKFAESWPLDTLLNIKPDISFSYKKWYEDIPADFWKWVMSISNLDLSILYNITMISNFLKN